MTRPEHWVTTAFRQVSNTDWRVFNRLTKIVLRETYGGLWHTTSLSRFQAILEVGAIVPNPDIDEQDRWGTSRGAHYYPYVRSLNGISLFDFEDFDPISYRKKYPSSAWDQFLPFQRAWGCAVWIEIDRATVATNMISPDQLVARWHDEGACRRNILPRLEAAHIGPIKTSAFRRAFLIAADSNEIRAMTLSS